MDANKREGDRLRDIAYKRDRKEYDAGPATMNDNNTSEKNLGRANRCCGVTEIRCAGF